MGSALAVKGGQWWRSGPICAHAPRWLLAGIVGGVLAATAAAAEPWEAFLEGLKKRGWHDTALDYLASMESSQLATPELRSALGYRMALCRLDLAMEILDADVRLAELEKSAAALEGYLAGNPPRFEAAEAALALGRVQLAVGRSRHAMNRQSSAPASPSTKPSRQACEWIRASIASLQTAEARFQELYRALPPNQNQEDKHILAQRDLLRQRLLEAKVMVPTARSQLGQALGDQDPAAKEYLREAAAAFEEIKEDYRGWAVAQVALVRAGRCYLALGDVRKAMASLDEAVWQLADDTSDRNLAAEATRYYLEACLHPDVNNFAEAVAKGKAFLEKFSRGQGESADGLAVRFHLARACAALAAQVRGGAEKRRYTTEARRLARFVASQRGEFQAAARTMLAESATDSPAAESPTDFATAERAGNAARDAWLAAVKGLQQSSGPTADPSIAELQHQRDVHRQQALDAYNLALRLASGNVPVDQLNLLRYYLCYLYWDAGRPEEAAILGTYLVHTYPRDPSVRKAAQVALASAHKLYESAEPSDREAAMRRLAGLAGQIVDLWPDQAEGQSALSVLIDVMARHGDPQGAIALLNRIPAGSAQRFEAEVRAGQAFWAACLAARRGEPAGPAGSNEVALRDAARAILEQSAARLADATAATPVQLGGVVSLGQLYLDMGQPDAALALLESRAPMLLRSPASGTPLDQLRLDAHKLAMRAALAAQPPRLEQARQTLLALHDAAGRSDAARGDLQRLLMSMGGDQVAQLRAARDRGDRAAAGGIARKLELVLEFAARQDSDVDDETTRWLAGVFYEVAQCEALEPENQQACFRRAADLYARVVARFTGGEGSSPLALRLRQGECLRRAGDPDAALPVLREVLRERPTLLAAQVEAARSLSDRGKRGDRAALLQSVGGSEPNAQGENLVWGWGKIGQLTARKVELAETFFESRYNLALVQVQSIGGTSPTPDALRTAKNTILLLHRTRQDLVKSPWFAQFDALMRRIQRELGEPVQGLSSGSSERGRTSLVSNLAGT